jgi:hypothetical protein
MKAETKLLWLTALLSGEYVQGKEKLRTRDDKFCCLGVLCDVLPEEGEWKAEEYGNWAFVTKAEEHAELKLPESLVKKLGFASPFSVSGVGQLQGYYAKRNDQGSSFETIAELIDIHLEIED